MAFPFFGIGMKTDLSQSCGTGVAAAWHWIDFEEIPHIPGQRNPSRLGGTRAADGWHWPSSCAALKQGLCGAGATLRRYPTYKGRETPAGWAAPEQRMGGSGLVAEQCWSRGSVVLGWLWGDASPPGAKEKPQQDGKRGEIMFRIKLHAHPKCSEHSHKPCADQDPESPQRLGQSCVWMSPGQVWVSRGLLQGQGLWAQQTWVWHKSSWKRSPLTHHRATRTHTGLGKQTLGGTDRTLWAPGPRRKEQWPYKRLTQTCLWASRSLQGRRGSAVACCRVGGAERSSACMGPFEGGHHSLPHLKHTKATPSSGCDWWWRCSPML